MTVDSLVGTLLRPALRVLDRARPDERQCPILEIVAIGIGECTRPTDVGGFTMKAHLDAGEHALHAGDDEGDG